MTQPEKNTLETILVVENHPVVRGVVRKILESAGFRILTAETGAQAIQADITQGTIHLLLSNVMLPDMSGPRVVELIKKNRPDVRVVMMSGYRDGDMLFLNHGWHFIEKACVAAELVERVNEVLHTPERSQGDYQFDTRIM